MEPLILALTITNGMAIVSWTDNQALPPRYYNMERSFNATTWHGYATVRYDGPGFYQHATRQISPFAFYRVRREW